MTTTGRVADRDPKGGGMVAVLTEGGYSIFEIPGEARPSLGDEIEWEGGAWIGRGTVRNVTREESYEVMMQDHGLPADTTKDELRRILGRRPLR